jgi:hypothetical protein
LPAGQRQSARVQGQLRRTGSEGAETEGDADYADASEFLEAAGAADAANRVLAVAYYHQMILNEGDWASMTINNDLKHVGHPVANITTTFDRLMKRRPALVRQVKKSGKTKQARKLYSLTAEGQRAVQLMLSGQPAE